MTDTTPLKPHNNVTWFWPRALKIVASPPPEEDEPPAGAARPKQRAGSNAKRKPLDIELPPGSKTVRFGLDGRPWGSGKKIVELVIVEGMFHAAKE